MWLFPIFQFSLSILLSSNAFLAFFPFDNQRKGPGIHSLCMHLIARHSGNSVCCDIATCVLPYIYLYTVDSSYLRLWPGFCRLYVFLRLWGKVAPLKLVKKHLWSICPREYDCIWVIVCVTQLRRLKCIMTKHAGEWGLIREHKNWLI